jgi:hypothetical protein
VQFFYLFAIYRNKTAWRKPQKSFKSYITMAFCGAAVGAKIDWGISCRLTRPLFHGKEKTFAILMKGARTKGV